jgi:hypothetical protein
MQGHRFRASGVSIIQPAAAQYYTGFEVLLNTNVYTTDPRERARVLDILRRWREEFAYEDVASKIFPERVAGDKITIGSGTPETGTHAKGSRPHIHFSVTAHHETQWNLGLIQPAMKDFTIQFLRDNGITNGFFLSIKLHAQSYRENYNNKASLYPFGKPVIETKFAELFPSLHAARSDL